MFLCFTFHYSLLVPRSETERAEVEATKKRQAKERQKFFRQLSNAIQLIGSKSLSILKGLYWHSGALAHWHSATPLVDIVVVRVDEGGGEVSWACCHSICKGKVTRWLREFYDLNAIYGANSQCHRHKARRQSPSLQSQPRAGAGAGPGNQTVWRCRALPC